MKLCISQYRNVIPTNEYYLAFNNRLGLVEFYIFSYNFFGTKMSEETPSVFNKAIWPSAPSEMVIESSPINRAK